MSKLRALVADDNFFNRDLAQLALEFSGYDVTLAVDGREALSQLAVAEFDLLLLDLQMPNMDGLSALKIIRQKPQGEHKMVIVVMTAMMPAQINEQVYALADYVRLKPLDVMDFRQFLMKLREIPHKLPA